jgi:hypothetical protein
MDRARRVPRHRRPHCEAMRSYLKTVVIGGILSLPLLGFGVGFVAMGVDATMQGWASLGGAKHRLSRTPTRTHDTTRLYGPGVILAGASLCVGGLLVIPSGLTRDHGKGRRLWPRVALMWKLVGAGAALGFGMAILASIINVLQRS